MRQFILLILIINFSGLLNSQCLPSPNIDFSGTKIGWAYKIEDPLMDTTLCQDEVKFYQRANLWVKPIEYDDKFNAVFSNGHSGTIINAIEKSTGNLLWQKVYNHTNTEETRGFRCPFVKKLGGDSLELLGFRSYYSFEPNKQFSVSTQGGFPNRIIISHKTGEQLDYRSIQGYNLLNSTGLGLNEYPKLIHNENIFYTFSMSLSNKEDETFFGMHGYYDSNTLKRFYNWPPFNELMDKAAPSISLKHFSLNGERPDYYFYIPKVLELDSNINAYLFKFQLEGKQYHHILKLDEWGNFISEKDISDQISSDGKVVNWDDLEVVSGNKIRIRCSVPKPDFYEVGHQGYVELDFNGNLLKDKKELTIDGLRPIFLESINLTNSEDILHIFRPQENNNIYFYKEYTNGEYIKVGELINNNRTVYAFQPVLATQAKDGDLLVGFSVLLDSLVNNENSFNSGGWGTLLKIEAEDLGLIVGTTESNTIHTRLKIHPNPTNSIIHIQGLQEEAKVSIQDVNGQVIKRVATTDGKVDISELPNGLYIFEIQNKHVVERHKVVKIE